MPPAPAPAADLQVSLYIALIVALVLTWPTGALIHRRYRSAVRRMMRSGSPAPAPPPAPAVPPLRPAPLRVEVVDAPPPAAAHVALRAREGRLRWAAAGAGAGVCHAVATTAYVASAEGFASAPQLLILFYVSLWPVVFITTRMLSGRGVVLAGVAAAYLAAGQLLGPQGASAAYAYLLTAGLATVLLLAVSNRRLGGIGPLVFGALAAAAMAALLGIRGVGGLLIEQPGVWPVLVTGLAGLGMAAVAAGAVLAVIARRYEAGRTSGDRLVLDAQWLVLTAAQAGLGMSTDWVRGLGAAGAVAWFAVGLLPFAVFLAARAALTALPRRHAPTPGVPMLLLRTFGARRRSERLMEELGAEWRFVGSIEMIAGEDLASANLEPHELMDFITGRLGGRFVNAVEQAPAFVARMDRERDADGRYRVNELFCRDDTWKAALQAVLAHPRPVLLDLRGFTEHNHGCVYEMSYLANHLPLRNLVLVVDETTQRPALEGALRQAWTQMAPESPNRNTNAVLRIVDLDEGRPRPLAALRGALFQAAAPEPAPVAIPPAAAPALA